MPVTDYPTAETIPYRLLQVEHKASVLDETKASVSDMHDLAVEFRGLRETLTKLLLAIVGSTLVFAGGVIGIAVQLH